MIDTFFAELAKIEAAKVEAPTAAPKATDWTIGHAETHRNYERMVARMRKEGRFIIR